MRRDKVDFFVIFVGRGLQIIYALMSIRLSTSILGPTQIGRMNLILAITSWFGLLLISPVGNYVFRQAIEWNSEGQLLRYLRRYGLFLGVVASVAAVILIIINSTLEIGTTIDLGWLLWLVVGALFLGALNTAFITLINTLGFRGWFVIFINLTSWLGLGFAVALTLWLGSKAEEWMSGLLLGQIVVMLFAGVVVHRVADRQPKNSENSPTPGFDVSSVFRFSWPLIFTTCFYWIQNSGYRFLLVRLTDEASIGLLVTGLAIAVSPLTMFDTLFTEYYRPVFYQDIAYSDSVQKTRAWNHYASAYFPAIVLVATLLAFGGPLLAQLLVSKEFQGVSWLAFWGALIQSALMVYSTYVYLVFASLDTRVMIWPNIAGAAVVVFGILLMAPWKPLLGSGIALSLGMFITTWSLAQILKRKFYLHLPWRRIIFAGLLSLPMAVGLNWFRQIYSEPSLLQAISALAFAGLYMLGSQFILAREWLFQRKNQTSPRPNAVSLQKKDVKL